MSGKLKKGRFFINCMVLNSKQVNKCGTINMTNGGIMYSKGDIVIIQFPFSDLLNAKKRPMVVDKILANPYFYERVSNQKSS